MTDFDQIVEHVGTSRLRAAEALPTIVQTLGEYIHDGVNLPSGTVAAAELLAKLSGAMKQDVAPTSAGSGFSLTIKLGDGRAPIELNMTPQPVEADDPPTAFALTERVTASRFALASEPDDLELDLD